MAMFTIDNLDFEQSQVYFSSEMSSFCTHFEINKYDDVSMNGELETPITTMCVTVRSQCHVFIDTDGSDFGDIVLDAKLTDDMCRELAGLIEQELK